MRARTAVPAALLLAIVAGLGWLVMTDAPAPAGGDSTPAEPISPDRAPPAERVDRTHGQSQKPTLNTEPADAGLPDGADAPPLDGRAVRVLDGDTGEALPGAELAFLAVAAGDAQLEFEDLGEGAVARVFTEGRQLVAGPDGRARIGTVPHRALVAARSNGHEGLAWSRAAREDELQVRVYRRTSLRVRVVDAAGRPVGGLGVILAERSEWDDLTRARARTDSTTGEATLPALRPAAEDEKLVVSVAAPFAPQPEVVVDLRQPPQDVIELQLPPAGAVVFEIVDELGAPTGEGESVALRRRPGPGFGDVEDDLVFRLDEHIHERAIIENGQARFPLVGIGLELEARLAPRGGNRVTTHAKFAGPTGAGEEVRVRLLLGPPRPVLIGRVVTPEGEPVPDLHLFGQVLARGESAQFFRHDMYARTAADGRFRVQLDRLPEHTAGRPLRLGRRVDLASGGRTIREFAQTTIPDELPPSGGDLGDLVLGGNAVLVSGVVVDDAGQPLAGAQLAVMQQGRKWRYQVDGTEAAKSDADGRFELRGQPDAEELSTEEFSVGASLAGHFLADDATFRRGATDVRITLSKAGGIAGSVVRNAQTRDQVAMFLIQGPAQDVYGATHRGVQEGTKVPADTEGGFEIRTLRPGTARVVLQLGWNQDDRVLTIDGVAVVAGEVTRDPRLQRIDLSRFLKSHAVRVVGPDGRPVPEALVHYRKAGGGVAWDRTTANEEGVATVPSRAEAVDVIVQHEGHAAVGAQSVSGSHTIQLTQAKRTIVTVRLKAGSPLPDPPHEVEPRLEWLGPIGSEATDDGGWGDPRTVDDGNPFPNSREVSLAVLTPGRYRVTTLLWKTEISGANGSDLPTDPRTTIVSVPGDGQPIAVEIAVDAKALASRLAEGD